MACRMSILDIGPFLFGGVDKQIEWLQRKGLLAQNKTCPACNQAMMMQPRRDVTDQNRYYALDAALHAALRTAL